MSKRAKPKKLAQVRTCRESGGRCDKPAETSHSCPYNEEINDDYSIRCGCCADCRHDCIMDI